MTMPAIDVFVVDGEGALERTLSIHTSGGRGSFI
jgi:hypothetical protein